MSVSNQETQFPYIGNGVTVTFPYNCQVQKAGDLDVYVAGALVTSGFTINGVGSLSGGSVTFAVAPAAGVSVVLERVVDLERTTDYQQNGDFLSRVVNPDFDRLWMALQQFRTSLSRALRFPRSDTNPVTELPPAADRANKVLAFDEFGNPVMYTPQSGTGNDFSAPTGSRLIGFIVNYLGGVYRNVLDKLRENVSAADFGAINDGVQSPARGAANRIAIQAAIDAMSLRGGGVVTIGGGGIYYLDVTTYLRENGAVFGIHSIMMKDNVSLVIEHGTTIKLMDFQYGAGAFYRMFSSRDQNMLRNARISGGGTVDGNVANQTASGVGADAQCSNIQLECRYNVVVENINSINANGVGIMLRGRTNQLGEKLRILGCNVDTCKNIGIQSSSFTGLVISDNNISNCDNNAIDVYGNDGTATAFSYNFTITGNVINRALTGIFLETVRLGVVDANTITLADYGIIVNRINGEPRGLVVSNNTMLSCPIGVRVTGDTRGVSILDNTIDQFSTAGITCGGGGGSSSYIIIKGNIFAPVNNTTSVINIEGATASFIVGRSNTIILPSADEAYFVTSLLSTIQTSVSIRGFNVLPFQVGPDEYAEFFEAPVVQLNKPTQRVINVTGPVIVSVPDQFAGELWVDGYQPGSGRARRVIEFRKVGGVLKIFTQTDRNVDTGTPFAAATINGANVQINFVAGANNYATWGVIGAKAAG